MVAEKFLTQRLSEEPQNQRKVINYFLKEATLRLKQISHFV